MNTLSVLQIAYRRLWANKGLTLCAIMGLVVTVALVSSVPLYTDAAYFRVLAEQLEQSSAAQQRPPFAFMYRYVGAWHGAVEWEDYEPVNQYLTLTVPSAIGLPVQLATRSVRTSNLELFPATEAAYVDIRQPLGWVNLGFVEGIEYHIEILEGSYPREAGVNDEVVEALVSRALADQTGIQVDEEYIAFSRRDGERRAQQVRVRVSGIWVPIVDGHVFWPYHPRTLEESLLVAQGTFHRRLAPAMSGEVFSAVWYIVFDGADVRTDGVPELLGRIGQVNSRVSSLLRNTFLDISPVEALNAYRRTTFLMTIVLYVFAAPILGLVLYFVGVISGLIVTRQRGEIAVLKSRGASDLQVLGIYVVEGAMIGAVGLVLGLLLGRGLAIVMGNTLAFLSFGQRVPLPVVVTTRAVQLALLGIGVAMLASLLPALQAVRLTIVSHKQDRARSLRKPFWQRYMIDVWLLAAACYGYYLLYHRGTLGLLSDVAGDPFQNPMLFLAPSLAILALSLMIIRLFPVLMGLVSWFTVRMGRSVAALVAFRQLARNSSQYTGSLLLLVLTLGLATFSASMARTLDRNLYDRMSYRFGSDYHLVQAGELITQDQESEAEGAQNALTESDSSSWVFVPVSEHLRIDGVEAATRVGAYQAQLLIGEERNPGVFYGIDRLDFPNVAFFRRDFAPSDLGTLMNHLALDRAAVLVSQNVLEDHHLKVGDQIELRIAAWGNHAEAHYTIADVLHYFPTYFPDDLENRYLFVGNLDYLFQEMGGQFPYDVWVRTSRALDIEQTRAGLRELDINVLGMEGSREAIERERMRAERTGVLGILSVGFMFAGVLTALGFMLHSFISFRQRHVEFGVLRAIGLSAGQMLGFLSVEQLVLILIGIAAGTGVGVWVSHLFIPFLQVGAAKNIDIPPFEVIIAWYDALLLCLVFGVMLMCAVAGMLWFLRRLRIFEAVKLGEAV